MVSTITSVSFTFTVTRGMGIPPKIPIVRKTINHKIDLIESLAPHASHITISFLSSYAICTTCHRLLKDALIPPAFVTQPGQVASCHPQFVHLNRAFFASKWPQSGQ